MREKIAEVVHDALPISPFLGPPLPTFLGIFWPDFMLSHKAGLITDINLDFMNTKSKLVNIIAGREKYSLF
jgi:hypothetical protein